MQKLVTPALMRKQLCLLTHGNRHMHCICLASTCAAPMFHDMPPAIQEHLTILSFLQLLHVYVRHKHSAAPQSWQYSFIRNVTTCIPALLYYSRCFRSAHQIYQHDHD
jgi:hypothetical protein